VIRLEVSFVAVTNRIPRLIQFEKFMKTIRELTNRVEEAHSRHLREVKSLEDQTRRITSEQAAIVSGSPAPANAGVDFESLVNGKSNTNPLQTVSADMFGDMNNSTPSLFPPSAPSPSPLSYSPQPANQSIPTQQPVYSSSAASSNYSPYQQSQLAASSFAAISPIQTPLQPMSTGGSTASYGQQTTGFGQQTPSYGQHTSNYGQQTSSFSQQNSSLGQQTSSFEQQSSGYGQMLMSSSQSAKPAINWGSNTNIPTLQPPKSNNSHITSQAFSQPAARTPSATTPNYSAMQNLSLNSTSSILQPQQQQMSSGMGMLQPLSSMHGGLRTTAAKATSNKKSSDLDLFDPLG
jgi:SCY1-like protein 2